MGGEKITFYQVCNVNLTKFQKSCVALLQWDGFHSSGGNIMSEVFIYKSMYMSKNFVMSRSSR